jgi:hypothetical protein
LTTPRSLIAQVVSEVGCFIWLGPFSRLGTQTTRRVESHRRRRQPDGGPAALEEASGRRACGSPAESGSAVSGLTSGNGRCVVGVRRGWLGWTSRCAHRRVDAGPGRRLRGRSSAIRILPASGIERGERLLDGDLDPAGRGRRRAGHRVIRQAPRSTSSAVGRLGIEPTTLGLRVVPLQGFLAL